MPSASGQPSKIPRRLELFAAGLFLAAVSAGALAVCGRRGWTLYYGDAEAHLNIARRIVDARTPGLRQIGTVWLPVPHLLMAPFARIDTLWQSGLAGALPSAVGFVVAGAFLFAAARRLFGGAAAAATLAVFALNPNLLYLQSTPMSEPIFLAAIGGLFYCAVRFHEAPLLRFAAGAGVAAFVASLTRYESWFLLPFVALFFLVAARRHRVRAALLFAAIAGLGPLLWLFHNWWWFGDGLAFLRGPYSAGALYRHALAAGVPPYPGDHHWIVAALYYGIAVRLCTGWPLMLLAGAGLLAIRRERLAWPILLLAPAPLFYLWTIHSGGIHIDVPELSGGAYYNTRYGLEALPLLAVAAGALVARTAGRTRVAALGLTGLVAVAPWLRASGPLSACWQEAKSTSVGRRASTDEAAAFLRGHYRHGDGIAVSFGDLTGVLREAGIPLRESRRLDEDAAWALTTAATPDGRYGLVETISHPGAPTFRLWRRHPVRPRASPSSPPMASRAASEAARGRL